MSSAHPVGQGFRTSVRRYLVAPLVLLIAALVPSALPANSVSRPGGMAHRCGVCAGSDVCLHGRRHFGRQEDNLIRIVPSWMPRPRQTTAATCVLELRTVGLLLPSICLAVLLIAMLLANVKAPSAAPATALPTRRPALWMTQPSW